MDQQIERKSDMKLDITDVNYKDSQLAKCVLNSEGNPCNNQHISNTFILYIVTSVEFFRERVRQIYKTK